MKSVLAMIIGMSLCTAHGETIEITAKIQVVKPDAICAKAIAVLTKAKNVYNPQEFVTIDGKLNTGKCLEAIFSELSSPTNGYKVIAAQQYRPGQ